MNDSTIVGGLLIVSVGYTLEAISLSSPVRVP